MERAPDDITKTADEIIRLYEQYGNEDYVGEPVSQIEHMCQCAQLAEAASVDDDMILAAFLHDIGHLYAYAFPESELEHMDGFGVVDHEKIGGDFLRRKRFSEKVTKLVASHVAAKRYLTFKFPEYYHLLSDASKQTLEFQGGRMNEEEAAAFENDPLSDSYIALRRWDEQAKEAHKPMPALAHYRQLIIEHLAIQDN